MLDIGVFGGKMSDSRKHFGGLVPVVFAGEPPWRLRTE